MYTKQGIALFLFSLAGTLFAGYLSIGKLISSRCVIDSGCSYFLGYPTCYYGFALFFTLFILSFITLMNGARASQNLLKCIVIIAGIGILFSGYFSAIEVTPMITEGIRYSLFFPTCVYGLVFYILIACTAWQRKSTKKAENPQPVQDEV
ncbi:hypothetical protein COU17_00800 [Candidatus Kaiserbacteria bacterium CG10_big_fil_rev_8_21_14_0_10_49_17]|uniref:Vitamin K epoxide reductase domain-containing protein n=1 Tax=Candidatus Kaiserbacteria bacterium CG10_big_fil_rev_8_21_14_0_10_49_17 TaxID=1974609 RepID=A0A2M6WEU9_9BACT|nr:MAG: hypothetical protein COU17_00800 [Candidatus Kaiserbacteria bacterium CG10_big_fil_rev_8_21_14_0_10_49_17]